MWPQFHPELGEGGSAKRPAEFDDLLSLTSGAGFSQSLEKAAMPNSLQSLLVFRSFSRRLPDGCLGDRMETLAVKMLCVFFRVARKRHFLRWGFACFWFLGFSPRLCFPGPGGLREHNDVTRNPEETKQLGFRLNPPIYWLIGHLGGVGGPSILMQGMLYNSLG